MFNIQRLLAVLAVFMILSPESFARDRDKEFGRGRGPWRGNEHSERPGRVPVGRPSWGGSGCPAGTMNVVFAPDNLSFSILFDRFIAETQAAGSGDKRSVMSCDALIPIELPAGMQMEITRVDYRGFVSLPAQARARLSAMYNFRDRRGGERDRMRLRFAFQGPVMDNYTISTDLLNGGGDTPNPEISPCGGTTVLRVFNQLDLMSPVAGTQAQVTIDSIDGQANAVYYVNWRRCTSGKFGEDRDQGRGGRHYREF